MPTFRRWLRALFPVHTRRGLLSLTILAQILLLAFGLSVILVDMRHQIALKLQDRILDQSIRTVESFGKTLDSLNLGTAVCGSPACEQAQRLIEDIRLPAGGLVCLLDVNDHIICHPDLRANPSICGTDLHKMPVIVGGATRAIPLGNFDRSQVISGRASYLRDGTHYIAAKYIPSLEARLLVQQPESGLLAFSDAASSGTMLRAVAIGLSILALTGVASFVLIRRHDRVLEDINAGLEVQVARRVKESMAARHALIFGLAKLAESRDSDTGEHLERICAYSDLLAQHLRDRHDEITESWLDNLHLAASLHDIGKVGIPDAVLLKPGKLSPEERRIIERHPLIGADTLVAVRERLGDDEMVNLSIQVALSHHERWDGSGYPYGLNRDEIPLSARIVALADVYDALTSSRTYKPPMSHEDAVDIIRKAAGSHFDPTVVEAFLATAEKFRHVRAGFQNHAAAP